MCQLSSKHYVNELTEKTRDKEGSAASSSRNQLQKSPQRSV